MARKELLFKLKESDPHSLPMARLADYLKSLATLLGNDKHIHFLRVDEGSIDLAMEVDETAESLVTDRVQAAFEKRGSQEAQEAFNRIFSMLDQDKTPAVLEWTEGTTVWEFHREKDNEQETFGPFWEEGSLDGMLVKIGGMDETVPVHLLFEGNHYTCNASRDLAKALSPYLFRNPIRVHGKGKWYRNARGEWEMHWFDIHSFEPLDDTSIPDTVARLRSAPGNDLFSLTDPVAEILKLRISED